MSVVEAATVLKNLPPHTKKEDLISWAKGLDRVAIVKTSWYQEIIEGMEISAESYLNEFMHLDKIQSFTAPGAFDAPFSYFSYYRFRKARLYCGSSLCC